MKHASLRQLKIFCTLAETGSMTKTAAMLHMTQSGISQHLQMLEQAANMVLFDRLPRQLVLTEAGQAMLPYAAEVLLSMKRLNEAAASYSGQTGGVLRLAAVSSGKYFVPQILAQFLAQAPKVAPQLILGNREKVLESLMRLEVDVAITGRPPTQNPHIVSQAFAPNRLLLVTHPDCYPKRQRATPLTAEALAQAPWLLREVGSGTRDANVAYWKSLGIQPKNVLEMDSIESIKQSVMANLGMSLLSHSSVKHELIEGRLIAAPAVGLPIDRAWHILTLKARNLSPAAQNFVTYLLEEGHHFV